MHISLISSRLNGFKKWSDDHPANGNDDDSGGATPIALAVPSGDNGAAEEPPHRPWVIPGVGGAF